MKIQIQRVAVSPHYLAHEIDTRLMEGTIVGGIRRGQPMEIQFARIGEGRWFTTKVVKTESCEDGSRLVHTKNSIYRVIKGWKD